MKRKNTITIALLVFLIGIEAQQPAKKPASQPVITGLKTQVDTLQYCLGAYLGQYIVGSGFGITNAELFLKGFNDALGKLPLLVKESDVSLKIEQYQTLIALERARALESKLFEELKSKPGNGMLPNGVYYSISKNGTGIRPQANDSVVIHLKGMLPDGKLFEDTYVKNKPYRVTPAGLIAGLQEIVQFMPQGSVWRVYIPSKLAFADKGINGLVPPHSAVVFDVELVKVN